MWVEGLSSPSPPLALGNWGGEEEGKEEATSGLSEAPSREYRVLDWPPCWGREAEGTGTDPGWPRKAEGKVVGVRKKQINRVAEAIIMKRKSH